MKNKFKKIITLLLVIIMTISMFVSVYANDNVVINTAAQLKASISTLDEAIKYLDKRYPKLWCSAHLWSNEKYEYAYLRSAEEILNSKDDSFIGRSDIATVIAYLLSDNMDISAMYGFSQFADNSAGPTTSAIYIYKDNKYTILDPVVGMKDDLNSRFSEFDGVLPNATVSNLSDYVKLILSNNSTKNMVDFLYIIKEGQQINFTVKNGWVTVTSPSVKAIYENKEKKLSEEEYIEKKYGHIKPENVGKYKLSSILGGLTMTTTEAKALVGKPQEVIKEKVKTAGDMFLYMLASKILLKNGDEQVQIDGHWWHYNSPAYETLESNLGNCGRMANLANYLLESDYQEIGFILHSYPEGNGGGHVYNYIKYKNKYYIVDFSSYLFNNYNVNSEFNIISLDKLEDYGTRWKECYSGLASIIAHTSPSMHLPNVWEGNYCYYPESSKFKVLMETPQMKAATLPVKSDIIDWTKPQTKSGKIESTNTDIIKAKELDLVPDDLNFAYKNNITRAEFCALMVKVYEKLKGPLTKRKAFLDTLDLNVQKMGALGVVNNEIFDPDKAITREQIAIMLSNLAFTLDKPLKKSLSNYKDNNDISVWAIEQVGKIKDTDFIVDIKDNMFLPKSTYTREQSILTILKFYEKMK
jgi:hypothetical protein